MKAKATLTLTTGEQVAIDRDKLTYLQQWSWYGKASQSSGKVYAARNVRIGNQIKTIRMHRLLLGCENDMRVVHHKDGNPLNNTLDNLVLMESADHTRYHSTK